MHSLSSSTHSAHPYKAENRSDSMAKEEKKHVDWTVLVSKLRQIESMLYDLEIVFQKEIEEMAGKEGYERSQRNERALRAGVMEATSGIAMVMGLHRRELESIMRFVDFRNQFPQYEEEELFSIVEKKGSLGLLAKFGNVEEEGGLNAIKSMSAKFTAIQQAWEKAFPDQSLSDIRKLIYRKVNLRL